MKWYQDSDGNTSGKRIFGAIGFVLFEIMAVVVVPVYSIYTGNDIGANAASGLTAGGWVSGGLLGIGVVEHLKTRSSGK